MGWWAGYAASRAVGKIVKSALGPAQEPAGDYLLPDEQARQALCARLESAPDLDTRDVHVSVLSGELVLTGTVVNVEARSAVEALAHATAGVASVRNELTFRGASK